MPLVLPGLLTGYSVDRAPGVTLDGNTEIVMLVLKAHDEPERAFAISKADAMIIAHRLIEAAKDAQSVMLGKI